MPYCQKCGQMLYPTGECPNCTPGAIPPTYMPQNSPMMYSDPAPSPAQAYMPQSAPLTSDGFTPVDSKPKKNGLLVAVICIGIALMIAAGAALYYFVLREDSDKDTEKESASQDGKTSEDDEEVVVEEENTGEWTDLRFEIDGVDYRLPCDMEVFLDNGWEFSDSMDGAWSLGDEVAAGESSALIMERGYKATVYFTNSTGRSQNVEDCTVIAVSYMCEDDTLFAGVNIDDIDSTDEIIDIFGQPDYYSEYQGCVYEEDGKIMEVCYNDSGFADLSFFSEEAVDLGYRPDEGDGNTGAAWENLSFSVDGITYRIPCTVEDLLDNGWEFSDEMDEVWYPDDEIDARDNGYLLVDREYTAKIYISNPTGSVQKVKDCTVVAICYVCEDDAVFAGVNIDDIGSTDDIIDAFGQPDYYSEFHGCVYESNGKIMEVCYNEDTGYADLSFYTKEAVDLGYKPTEE